MFFEDFALVYTFSHMSRAYWLKHTFEHTFEHTLYWGFAIFMLCASKSGMLRA